MGQKLGEFFFDLVINPHDGQATVGNLASAITQLQIATLGEIALLSEFVSKLAMLSDHAIETAESLEGIKLSTGIDLEKWQKAESIGKNLGMSAGAMGKTLAKITQELTNAKFGRGNSLLPLSYYGVDMRVDPTAPERILKQLRASKAFMSLANADQSMLLRTTLGSDEVLKYIHATTTQLAEASKHVAVMSKEDQERWVEVGHTFSALSTESQQIGMNIAGWFSKDILETARALAKVFHQISEFTGSKDKRIELIKDASRFTAKSIVAGGPQTVALEEASKVLAKYLTKDNLANLMATWYRTSIPPELRMSPEFQGPIQPSPPPTVNVTVKLGARDLQAEVIKWFGEEDDHKQAPVAAQVNQGPL